MKRPNRLLVIIPDALSELVHKGEITARYYNPGDLFDEVHIVMTNDDRPDPSTVQKTVGRARLHLYNLPTPAFRRTLGWQPFMLQGWVQAGINLARQVRPALIRTYANFDNGYLAAQIKKHLMIPLVVSLHVLDVAVPMPWWPHWKSRLKYERRLMFEQETLRTADWVLPVYEPLRAYAARLGARHIQVCYNSVNPECLREKQSYALHKPARIISVGRQIKEKNPENLIRAVASLENTELLLVGDGMYHNHLQQVARECAVTERVTFRRAIPNDDLCQMLPEFDIFAAHIEGIGISKTTLEAFLVGLPSVLNYRSKEQAPELQGDWVKLVENSPDGYCQAFRELLKDEIAREALGHRAYRHAQQHYAPAKTEQVYVDIYRDLALQGSA